MTTFLGGEYARRSPVGGCAARSVRTRHEAQTLSQRLANAAEDAQRFDLDIVLRGDEGLRRRFFAHRAKHDITQRFAITVPQDPAITVPAANARVRTKGAAGDSELAVYSGSGAADKLEVGTFFAFVGGDRLYMVVGDADYVLPAAGSVDVGVYPDLDSEVPITAALDFAPTVPVKHSAGDGFAVAWDEQGTVHVKFTVRNDA